jgi:Uma2 family endonuclease
MAVELTRRRFTVAEYHQMAEAGILGEDDRIELIEGEIVEMSPIGRRHAATLLRLIRLFSHTFDDVADVNVQSPIQLGNDTEPEPDLTLLRRKPDFYASALPGPDDTFLVVEVAETSLAYDRRVKTRLYARSGIAEYWLIDLNTDTVTMYRGPGHDGYATSRIVRRGEHVAPAAFPDLAVAVDAMLAQR